MAKSRIVQIGHIADMWGCKGTLQQRLRTAHCRYVKWATWSSSVLRTCLDGQCCALLFEWFFHVA